MAALSYNYNIFTNVHKWDEEYTYLGIQVSGKLNQYNGQNYPILDAIDIDWDGAYVKALNSYVYTTEDLIKLFNKLGEFDTNISNNLINNYYNKDQFNEIFTNYQNLIAQQFDEMTVNMEEEILQNMLSRYELLNALSSILIDQTRYLEIPYDTLVKNDLDLPPHFIFYYAPRYEKKINILLKNIPLIFQSITTFFLVFIYILDTIISFIRWR